MTITLNGTTGITLPNGSASAPAATGSDTDTGIVYGTNTVQIATGGTTAVTVDSSQNVGIGTSSPAVKLQIGDNTTPALNFSDVAGSVKAQLIYRNSTTGNFEITNTTSAALVLGTANTERMRIDSSGNLLVGTTSTGLSNSNSIVIQPTQNTYANAVINHSSAGTSGSNYLIFGYNSGGIGSITQNGTTGVSYNTSSDYRLKENIAPMVGALGVVQQLKPVTYNWKVDGSSGQGFIAHELQEVVPDCVTGEKDAVEIVDIKDEEGNVIGQEERPVYQGIDTSFLVATLTAALQELNAKVDSLQAELATLKGQA